MHASGFALNASTYSVTHLISMKGRNIINTVVLTIMLLAGSVAAQTSTPATSTDDVPGTPNTGSGGNAAANIIMLTGSLAVALGGAAYLARRRTS